MRIMRGHVSRVTSLSWCASPQTLSSGSPFSMCVCLCLCLCMIIHRSRDSIPQPRHALHTNTYILYVYDIHTIHICDTIYDICMI